MADWKQITARIRRARTGKDPAGQLTNLFSKTRDAMVAFELARYFEANGNNADAGRWYLTAAERFRRSDWKTKAQESATRLGATEPAEIPAPVARVETPAEAEATAASETEIEKEAEPQPAVEVEKTGEAEGAGEGGETPATPARAPQHEQRRGRGRREQRGHRRGGHTAHERVSHHAPRKAEPVAEVPEEQSEREAPRMGRESESAPSLRGKYGDPGLSSRLTQLEMNFRRLLACSPAKFEDAGKAPAGPGVWVLTDSDLTSYYYVEACQTLRVAIPAILKGSGGPRRGEGVAIKPALAEHLGIPETRVAKYLADHCVVRWLQMDDDAAHFAHFLIAVLRPALNE